MKKNRGGGAGRFPATAVAVGEGKQGEEQEGGNGYPLVGLDGGGCGRKGCAGELQAAAAAAMAGATPAALGRGERVGEHRWEVKKLAARLIWFRAGLRREFDGGLGGGGSHGSGAWRRRGSGEGWRAGDVQGASRRR